jgi:tRNA threonylcarbamoyladenosine biosynthesis protein TsaB
MFAVRIAAIETSTRAASVALLEGGTLVAARSLPESIGTAAGLAPAIDEALRQAGWSAAELDLIAVSIGPGSFTGLRVGVTTAKALAYALSCEVLGIDSLEVIAAQASHTGDICAVLDAQRGQLFSGRFRRGDGGGLERREATHIVDAPAWLDSLVAGDLVTGPGIKRIVSRLPADVLVAPEAVWSPQAETVGRLALQAFWQGRRDDIWKLSPNYLRRSAAEEKRDAQPSSR